jgi:hypothetical protein
VLLLPAPDRLTPAVAVTYTNRKGVTYTLARTASKTGTARYVFTREPPGEPVAALPPGTRVSESVNGVVSLIKDTPAVILPTEVAVLERIVRRHPKPQHYRVGVHGNALEVYERSGPEAEELAELLGETDLRPAQLRALRDTLDRHARWTAVLCFQLADPERRTFRLERRCSLGGIDDWVLIGGSGPLTDLAEEVIPLLGTEELFERW